MLTVEIWGLPSKTEEDPTKCCPGPAVCGVPLAQKVTIQVDPNEDIQNIRQLIKNMLPEKKEIDYGNTPAEMISYLKSLDDEDDDDDTINLIISKMENEGKEFVLMNDVDGLLESTKSYTIQEILDALPTTHPDIVLVPRENPHISIQPDWLKKYSIPGYILF